MSGKIIDVFPLNIRHLEYTHERGRPQGKAEDHPSTQAHQETNPPPRQDQDTEKPPTGSVRLCIHLQLTSS